ncbi:hypothetical protein VCV18_011187 [Metarhizium anisopliae]
MQGVERSCRDATEKEMEDLQLVLAKDTPLDERIQAATRSLLDPYSVTFVDKELNITQTQEVEEIIEKKLRLKYYSKEKIYESFAVKWGYRGPEVAWGIPSEKERLVRELDSGTGWTKFQGGWNDADGYIYIKDYSQKPVNE